MKKVEKFIKGDTIVLRNVPVKWAALIDTDKPSWGGSQWKIDVVLTKKQADAFKEVGFNVKENKDGEWVYTATRKEVTAAGKKQKAPVLKDRDGLPCQDQVGNGSICNVKMWCKYWESPTGGSGLKGYLDEVQIVKLVEYSGGEVLGAIDSDEEPVTSEELPF